MKYRFTNSELIAAVMATSLISAGVQFKYLKHEGEHRFWALGEVPEACEPEKWKAFETKFDTAEFKPANSKD